MADVNENVVDNAAEASTENIVVDNAKSSWSDLWKKEDYWAIWIGFAIILFGYFFMVEGYKDTFIEKTKAYDLVIRAEETKPFVTTTLLQAQADKKALKVSNEATPKAIISLFKMPGKWKTNPLDSVYLSQSAADAKNAPLMDNVEMLKIKADAAYEEAIKAEQLATEVNYTDASLNATADTAVKTWNLANNDYAKAKSKLAKPYNIILNLIILGFVLLAIFAVGAFFMGFNMAQFAKGFLGVYVIALIAIIIGNQSDWNAFGVNAEVCAIVVGMLIANTIGTPQWLKNGAQVEYFIKTGLVCLGAAVLFDKLLAIGIPGVFVAWIVTPIVLVTTYIFGQKVLKIESKTLNITISADMSVCGTSAAIATAAACRAKKEELTIAVGLSLTFTAIMMIVIPAIANALGMPEVLAGAWIGGTVDSTGAVAAAGALIGPKAMQVAATIKMIQNILIGVTAFFVALYWTTKVDAVEGQKVSLFEIWHRFPKFVIGFLIASIFCSYLSTNLADVQGVNLSSSLFSAGLLSLTKAMQGWGFVLAFLSIGLVTNFRELAVHFKGGKPIILYVCGQSFNLCLTLFMAWIMFYQVFPEITASI